MKLSSLIDKDLIITDLKARDKASLIEEFVDLIDEQRDDGMREVFCAALNKREAQGGTALEKSVALPHARMPELDEFILAAGISKQGIDFGARDGKPSRLFFVMLAPPSKNTVLLHSMAAVAMLTINEQNRNELIAAETPAEFAAVVERSGVEVDKYLSCSGIMERDFETLRPDMPIKDAVDLFAEKGVDGMVVVDEDGRLLGEFTGREVISLGLPSYLMQFQDVAFIPDFEPFEEYFKKEREMNVGDAYRKEVFVVGESDSVLRAAFLMITKGRRRIYVTDVAGKLIGVVNRFDLISKVLFV